MAGKGSTWKQKLLLTLFSTLLIVGLAVLGEVYCRLFTRINFLDNSRGMFAYKRFGNSYGLTPNFTGVSFGETFYTDDEGFRIDPGFRSTAKDGADAVLIMGDSVAFGPALTDEVTISGDLRKAMPAAKILNGAAIGYDSFDYKTVTLARVAQHPEIKTVVLFICLNDISDASAQAIRSQNGQTSDEQSIDPSPSVLRRINDYLRSRSKLYLWLKNSLVDTQMFYFKYDLAGYQKGEQNVTASLKPVIELSDELRAKSIALKVFVSPYEAQLRQNPPEDAKLPQTLITEALTESGVEVYDLAPEFLKRSPNTNALFLYGDPMHLSADGAKVAANAACSHLAGCTQQ